MRKIFFLSFLILSVILAKGTELSSPDGLIKVKIDLSDRIYYSVYAQGVLLLEQCHLGIDINGLSTDKNLKVGSIKRSRISGELVPVTPMKFSKIAARCNQIVLNFKNGFSVEFRAYNEGIAYRIITSVPGDKNGNVKIIGEDATLKLQEDYLLHLQPAKDFTSNYETNYIHLDVKKWRVAGQMATLPALIDTKKGYKLLFAETDLSDYPCMFIKAGDDGISSTFSKVAEEEKQEGDRFVRITKEADYIAQTKGKRSYPWRYLIISKDDRELLESTLPVKLAPKSALISVVAFCILTPSAKRIFASGLSTM